MSRMTCFSSFGDVLVLVPHLLDGEGDHLEAHLVHVVRAGRAHAVAHHLRLLDDLLHRELADDAAQVPLQHQADQPLALLVAWLFGMGPALFGAAVALVPLAYLVDESHPRWYVDQRDIFWILLFFITALATAWLASTVRRLEDERTALLVRERAARAEAEA